MVNAKLKCAIQEFTVLMAHFEKMIWNANGFARIIMGLQVYLKISNELQLKENGPLKKLMLKF